MELYITTRMTKIPKHSMTWMKLRNTVDYEVKRVDIFYVTFKGTKHIEYKGSEQRWSWDFPTWMKMVGL